jgi:hypothetical protein
LGRVDIGILHLSRLSPPTLMTHASKRSGIAFLASPGVRTSDLSTQPPVTSYGPGSASVPHRASLAILRAADAIAVEEMSSTSAEGVRTEIEHDEFIESLGG